MNRKETWEKLNELGIIEGTAPDEKEVKQIVRKAI